MMMKKLSVLLLLISTVFVVSNINGQPGYLDPTFNIGSGFSGGAVSSTTIQTDDKIIAGGNFTSYNGFSINRIVRLDVNGLIDSTFNPGSGFNSGVNSIAVQTDGKILVGGSFTSFDGVTINHFVRLNTDGTLDPSFNPGTGPNNAIEAIAIQTDGKIILGGHFNYYNGSNIIRIVRLNPDGTLDATFNPGTGFNSYVKSVVIQSDGKILVGGTFNTFNGITRNYMARLNSGGSLDASFDTSIGFDDYVWTITVQIDGKILVGGRYTSYNGIGRNCISRLNSDATLDTAFDPGTGFNGTHSSHGPHSIAIQSDGKIIAAGDSYYFNDVAITHIVRLYSNGARDLSFYQPGNGFNYWMRSVSLQSNDKIIVGGAFSAVNSVSTNRMARLYGNCSSNNTDSTINVVSCNSFTENNQTYTISGTYTQIITNVAGCDSTITINLTINENSTSTINPVACDTYTENGQTYTLSGTYTQVLQNATGCDSIITINLTIHNGTPPLIVVDSLAICTKNLDAGTGYQNYIWSNNQNTQEILVTETGYYAVTVEDVFGCLATDSVYVILPNCYDVYPGDANNDLIANNFDVLSLGLHFGEAGIYRDSVSNLWIGHNSLDWPTFQNNYNNVKFTDCNGDGIVNYNDTLAIHLNFENTYVRSNSLSSSGYKLSLKPQKNEYFAGDTIVIDIHAGESTDIIPSLYGIAFNLMANFEIMKENSETSDFTGWLTPSVNGRLGFSKLDYQNDEIFFALTKIDHIDNSGYGKIASISFITEDSIASNFVLNCSFTKIEAVESNGVPVNFMPEDAQIVIKPLPTFIDDNGINIFDVQVFPNPAGSEFNFLINSFKNQYAEIYIYNSLGVLITTEKIALFKGKNQKSFSLKDYASGVYHITIITNENKVNKRLIKN